MSKSTSKTFKPHHQGRSKHLSERMEDGLRTGWQGVRLHISRDALKVLTVVGEVLIEGRRGRAGLTPGTREAVAVRYANKGTNPLHSTLHVAPEHVQALLRDDTLDASVDVPLWPVKLGADATPVHVFLTRKGTDAEQPPVRKNAPPELPLPAPLTRRERLAAIKARFHVIILPKAEKVMVVLLPPSPGATPIYSGVFGIHNHDRELQEWLVRRCEISTEQAIGTVGLIYTSIDDKTVVLRFKVGNGGVKFADQRGELTWTERS